MMASRDLRVLLRDSEHNKQARAMLRQHQRGADMTQAEFADELSKEFHGRIALTTLNGYLTGKSGVPASVLLAAAAIAHRTARGVANSDDHGRSSGYPLARALAEELRELLAKEES